MFIGYLIRDRFQADNAGVIIEKHHTVLVEKAVAKVECDCVIFRLFRAGEEVVDIARTTGRSFDFVRTHLLIHLTGDQLSALHHLNQKG